MHFFPAGSNDNSSTRQERPPCVKIPDALFFHGSKACARLSYGQSRCHVSMGEN